MRPVPLCFVMVFLLTACGSSSQGSVSGTIAGNRLDVKDAIYVPSAPNEQASAFILLASVGDLCAMEGSGHELRDGSALVLDLHPSGAALIPGTYGVQSADSEVGEAEVTYLNQNDTCANTISQSKGYAVSGSVRLTRADSDTLEGTFDVIIGTQADHVTGSFVAPACTEMHTGQSVCE